MPRTLVSVLVGHSNAVPSTTPNIGYYHNIHSGLSKRKPRLDAKELYSI